MAGKKSEYGRSRTKPTLNIEGPARDDLWTIEAEADEDFAYLWVDQGDDEMLLVLTKRELRGLKRACEMAIAVLSSGGGE